MGRMVDALLELSRTARRELVRRPTQIGDLVDDVVTELKRETKDGEVDWRIDTLPVLHCDPTLIRQVLFNLLANAVKFSSGRGAVIAVGQVDCGGETAIYVRDNGVGF